MSDTTGPSAGLLKSVLPGGARSSAVSCESEPASGEPSASITVTPPWPVRVTGWGAKHPRTVDSAHAFDGKVTGTNPCCPSSCIVLGPEYVGHASRPASVADSVEVPLAEYTVADTICCDPASACADVSA